MVPNGSAYNNYPPFGTNGTKTPPGGSTESAKYALGMVPADTFPAEWANYLFYGATQGITRLNQDTGSIKKEINSVLSNYNITPDATLNNQLLEALTKLKAEAALAAHPVGSLYWTSVNENPATTFGGGTWEQIKDKFILAAGDTYSQGATGGSATVTLTEAQMPVHTHTMENAGSHSHTTNTLTNSSGTAITTTGNQSANPNFAGSQSHRHNLYVFTGGKTAIGNLYGYTLPASNVGSQSGAAYADKPTYQPATDNKNYISDTTVTIAGTTTGNHNHNFEHKHGTDSQGTHKHTINNAGGSSGTTQAHNNMPPYIVQYCWKRVS